MPPDALTTPISSSPDASPPSNGTDPNGAATNDPAIALAEKLDGASASAVGQHLAESKKSNRGKRGPDRNPGSRPSRAKKPVPLDSLDNGPAATPLAEGPPTPLTGVVEDVPAFDEETARALVEIGCGLLNDGAAAIVRAVAKKETGDDQLADEAAKAVRMSEKIEKAITTGGIQCAKKYAVRLDYAPEIMLGGGLVIWAGQVSLSVKALKAKGAEIRQRDEQRREAA
jgi:hypothetical protein